VPTCYGDTDLLWGNWWSNGFWPALYLGRTTSVGPGMSRYMGMVERRRREVYVEAPKGCKFFLLRLHVVHPSVHDVGGSYVGNLGNYLHGQLAQHLRSS